MKGMKGKGLDVTAYWLIIIGALNIGLAELQFDVLDFVFGNIPVLASIVNYIIGLAGLWVLYIMFFKK